MSKASRPILLVVISLVIFAQATVALAESSVWKTVDVTLQSEQQQSMLLVSGELPQTAKLPQEAELAVPTGTQLQWIGEILGGDVSKDPVLKYVKSTNNGMDIYRFTLTQSRVAQVEGIVPSATSFDGTNYIAGLKWTAWQAVPEVRISQRIPQGSLVVQAAPGASVRPGGTGYSYYTKTVKEPKAGDVLDLSFSYSLPAAGTTSASGSSSSTTDALVFIIIVVLFVGGFGLMVVNVNKKMAAKRARQDPSPRKSPKPVQSSVTVQSSKATTQTTKPSKKKAPPQELVVEAAPPKRMKPVVPMLVVVGIFIIGFVIVGTKGTSAAVVDGKISRNYGAASACQSVSLPFTANQGVDLAQQGELVLKGLEGMEGVGVVTVDLTQSKIDMAWCVSSQSEESMRQALSSSGLITLGQGTSSAASAPTTASIDASGKMQTAQVDTSSGSFAPGQIALKAGVPAEISFGSAAGCLSEVVISDLGIEQDLTNGPATVKLPALEAGTYQFACAMGHQSGQIVVQ